VEERKRVFGEDTKRPVGIVGDLPSRNNKWEAEAGSKEVSCLAAN
jgi:hypothetical protein